IWLVFFPPGCVVVSLDSDAICASSALPGEKNPTPICTIYFATDPYLAFARLSATEFRKRWYASPIFFVFIALFSCKSAQRGFAI
ncbi:MAG: hypothetical protein LBP30_03875, partial [Clostridiales Family XIII bacterium]|nr:hypothetical protein [Clostridiales Family XIII bacterium]